MKIVVFDNINERYEELHKQIQHCFSQYSIKGFSTAFSLVTYIYDDAKGNVDLVFINISENKNENISVAIDIQEYFPHIHIVFYSHKADCAEEIFEAIPSYFLIYPFKEDKVEKSLQRVVSNINLEMKQRLSFTHRGQIFKIRLNAINYIESNGRKLCIHSQDGIWEVNMTLDEMMSKLPEQFEKCHRSYIVNLDKILKITNEEIELLDHQIIPIARGRMHQMKERVEKYNVGRSMGC